MALLRRLPGSIGSRAREQLAALRQERAKAEHRTIGPPEKLEDFIVQTFPSRQKPAHLRALVDALDASRRTSVRAVVAAPPRHGKTETILSAFAHHLAHQPSLTHAYVTYEGKLARSKSRWARSAAQLAGVRFLDDRPGALGEWRTAAGGGLLATSIRGQFTGQGVSGLMVVDDPVKDRLEAESALLRQRNWEWFTDVAFTRRDRPSSTSIFVVMARWHEDDLAGRLVKLGWDYINLPAIQEEDTPAARPLWAEHFALADLHEIRRTLGPYSWASLYRGSPRPREGRVFRDAYYYHPDALPGALRVGAGIDLAYTAKTTSDWCVLVLMALAGDKFYVLDVLRRQAEPEAFASLAGPRVKRYPGLVPLWYASGTEKGVVPSLRRLGLPLAVKLPRGDKFVRAIDFAAAWNRGDVLVPDDVSRAPWSPAFLEELFNFTGTGGDVADDQVDAGTAAFDRLAPFAHKVASEVPSVKAVTPELLLRDNELGDV